MITRFSRTLRIVTTVSALCCASYAAGQGLGYGVNSSGQLFRFDLSNPPPNGAVTNIGPPLSFVPEGIDFRPTTIAGDPKRPLYGIDVGEVHTQLYTLDVRTGAATAVGVGFPSMVAGSYDLTTSTQFGFDFNPTTLQGDGSIRIRLISNGGVNLRLNSDTGLVANVDTPLLYSNQSSPFADAAAYINSNKAVMPGGGTTVLYDMDSRSDQLSTQAPPNDGTLNPVGSFKFVDADQFSGIHFDVLTDAADADPSIAGDHAYAVIRHNPFGGLTASTAGVAAGGNFNPWRLYNVNLATGETTRAAPPGPGGSGEPDYFTGGFATTYYIPEPSTVVGLMLAIALAAGVRRRE